MYNININCHYNPNMNNIKYKYYSRSTHIYCSWLISSSVLQSPCRPGPAGGSIAPRRCSTADNKPQKRRCVVEPLPVHFQETPPGFLVTSRRKVQSLCCIHPKTTKRLTFQRTPAHDTSIGTKSKSNKRVLTAFNQKKTRTQSSKPSFPNARKLVDGSGYFLECLASAKLCDRRQLASQQKQPTLENS